MGANAVFRVLAQTALYAGFAFVVVTFSGDPPYARVEPGDAFLNRLLGAATLDRLRHGAYRLTLEGESYRSPRPMPERRKSTVATGGKPKK